MNRLPAWLWSPARLRTYAVCVLAVAAVLAVVAVATAREGRTVFGSLLGGDFGAFYVAGQILREHGSRSLYDLELQERLLRETLPGLPAGERLPFVYAPTVAAVFVPLSLLSYSWALATWWVVILALYAGGLWLATSAPVWQVAGRRRMALWLALAFEPFLFETWLAGQLAAVGCFSVCLARWLERRVGEFTGGLALGLCWYKPTLLVVLVPLLLVTGRWRAVAGVLSAGLGLTAATWCVFPTEVIVEHLRMLAGYGRAVAAEVTGFRLWKFVDLVSASRWLGMPVVWGWGMVAVGWALCLAQARGERRLGWAAGLTLTLVLNVYAGVYDVVLVVPAALWTVETFWERNAPLPAAVRVWLTVVTVVTWWTQEVARVSGVQVVTVVLAGWGAYQLVLARRFGQDAGA